MILPIFEFKYPFNNEAIGRRSDAEGNVDVPFQPLASEHPLF
jgi:hypothetical protein